MDKYDEAIQYLTEHPREIISAWGNPTEFKAGCLFNFAGSFHSCGCLTQIKHEGQRAETPELTVAIREDSRIPTFNSITVSDLPVFAEWQRRLDKELNRP